MTLRFDLQRDGPLAFPVTPMLPDGSLDLPAFEEHLAWLLGFEPPALFVACGTGEFASLSSSEVGQLAKAAVDMAGTGVPVYVGAGQALGVANEFARVAEAAGAAGLLLFPPYQREAEPVGVAAYCRAVAQGTELPIVLYQRDGVTFEPETLNLLLDLPNVVGLKDGIGDVERIQRIVHAVGDRLSYFNGMPTAETYQPSYAAAGVPYYSSAVFNFVPEVSWAFWRALNRGDQPTVKAIIGGFFAPLAELRRKTKGYAISLVKAGVALRRGDVGPVRPPLVEVSAVHKQRLDELIAAGLELVASAALAVTTPAHTGDPLTPPR